MESNIIMFCLFDTVCKNYFYDTNKRRKLFGRKGFRENAYCFTALL